jgi:hypothetical protein
MVIGEGKNNRAEITKKKTKNTDDAGDGVALGGIVSTVANTLVAKSVNGLYANDS